MRTKVLKYYDSMNMNGEEILQILKRYLAEESKKI